MRLWFAEFLAVVGQPLSNVTCTSLTFFSATRRVALTPERRRGMGWDQEAPGRGEDLAADPTELGLLRLQPAVEVEEQLLLREQEQPPAVQPQPIDDQEEESTRRHKRRG